MSGSEIGKYKLREVAAVFHDMGKLDAAVERLLSEGFRDGDFNIMATDAAVRQKLKDRLEPVEKLADDPTVPRQAYMPKPTRAVAEAAAMGVPMFLLGMAGAAAVLASGGAAALALAVASATGALGVGVGAALANAIETSHAEALAKAMEAGGIVLWVRTPTEAAEKTAIRVLTEAGGEHVHAHEIERTWGLEDIPLSDFNPDPFLEPDPRPGKSSS